MPLGIAPLRFQRSKIDVFAFAAERSLRMSLASSLTMSARFRIERTLPDTVAEFDHYAPASYLTEHRASVLKRVTEAELESALARFENMFSAINALL